MQNPNNDGSALERSSQEKFAALTKLIKETQAVDTADLVKLKQMRDKLAEILNNIENTTSATSRDENQLTVRKAEDLISDIDKKYLNPVNKIPGLGMGSIITELKDASDIAGSISGTRVYTLTPVAHKVLNSIIQTANKGITYIAPAVDTTLAVAAPVAGLTLGGMFYLEILARLADELDKSLVYRMHSSRGGGIGPAEMRKMFLEVLERKLLVADSLKALESMPATFKDNLLSSGELLIYEFRIIQTLLPDSQAAREQWQSTMEKYEALQEYKARHPDSEDKISESREFKEYAEQIRQMLSLDRLAEMLDQAPHRGSRGGEKGPDICFGKIDVEAARRWLAGSFPKPGQSPQDHLPASMQKTRDENLGIYGPAYAAVQAAVQNPDYHPSLTRDELINNRADREKLQAAFPQPGIAPQEHLPRQIHFTPQEQNSATPPPDPLSQASLTDPQFTPKTNTEQQASYSFPFIPTWHKNDPTYNYPDYNYAPTRTRTNNYKIMLPPTNADHEVIARRLFQLKRAYNNSTNGHTGYNYPGDDSEYAGRSGVHESGFGPMTVDHYYNDTGGVTCTITLPPMGDDPEVIARRLFELSKRL